MLAILKGLLARNILIVLIRCLQVWLLCKGCAPVLRQVLLDINSYVYYTRLDQILAVLIKHYVYAKRGPLALQKGFRQEENNQSSSLIVLISLQVLSI